MKRLLDCSASDFQKMSGQDLKQSIRASEGRVLLSETIASVVPLYPDVTNAEVAASFGADLLLLNVFDVFHPMVKGFECDDEQLVVQKVKELTGRPVGLNLEPVDVDAEEIEKLAEISPGRLATEEALEKAKNLGFDFVCLTGNPKTGVTNAEITTAIEKTRAIFGEEGLIIAGKMHGAGVAGEAGSEIISQSDLAKFIDVGADVILIPAPGTVPGMTLEVVESYVRYVHSRGALVMLTIGTSQEGADEETIRKIAFNSKMAGADI